MSAELILVVDRISIESCVVVVDQRKTLGSFSVIFQFISSAQNEVKQKNNI